MNCWVSDLTYFPRSPFPVFYPLTLSDQDDKSDLPKNIRRFDFGKEYLLTPRYFEIEDPDEFAEYQQRRIKEIKENNKVLERFEDFCIELRKKGEKLEGDYMKMKDVIVEKIQEDFKFLTPEEIKIRDQKRAEAHKTHGFKNTNLGFVYTKSLDETFEEVPAPKITPTLNDHYLIGYFVFDIPRRGYIQTAEYYDEIVFCPLALNRNLEYLKEYGRKNAAKYNYPLDIMQTSFFLNPIRAEEEHAHQVYESNDKEKVQYFMEVQKKRKEDRQVLQKFEDEGLDIPIVEIGSEGQELPEESTDPKIDEEEKPPLNQILS